jgi:S1-C subfamily serine protease
VGVQDVGPELAPELQVEPGAGALVNSVSDGGPGARAQLRPGDVVATVDGKRIHDAQDLSRELLVHEVGHSVDLEVLRGGRRYATNVELEAHPEPPLPLAPVQRQTNRPSQDLGLALLDLSPDRSLELGLPQRSFAMISQVSPGSPADRAGLRVGDVVVEADGAVDPNAAQVRLAGTDGHMLIRIRRRDAAFYAAVRL